MSATYDNELERVLNELVDGTLTEADEQRLAEILRTDASARRQYRQFMALHADLHWDYATVRYRSRRHTGIRTSATMEAGGMQEAAVGGRQSCLLIVVTGGFLLAWQWRGHGVSTDPSSVDIVPLAGEVQLADGGTHKQSVRRPNCVREPASTWSDSRAWPCCDWTTARKSVSPAKHASTAIGRTVKRRSFCTRGTLART